MGRTEIYRAGKRDISSKPLDEQRSSICSEAGSQGLGAAHWPFQGEKQEPGIGRVMMDWTRSSQLKLWVFNVSANVEA